MLRYVTALSALSAIFLTPLHAVALSCEPAQPWDHIEELNRARSTPDQVAVGHGIFSDGVELSDPSGQFVGSEIYSFRFDGVMFEKGAIIQTDQASRVISKGCDHPIWCESPGHPQTNVNYLVVFDREPSTGQLSIFSHLCGDTSIMLHLEPPDLERIAQCLSNRDCTQANF